MYNGGPCHLRQSSRSPISPNFSNVDTVVGLVHSGSLLRLAIAVNMTILSLSSEIFQTSLGVGLHALAAVLPAGRADLAVLIGELEGLNEADGLLDIATDGKVIDGDLTKDAFRVDDE